MKYFTSILFTLILHTSFSQDLYINWLHAIGGLGGEVNMDITSDSYGNIFISGNYTKTVDFNPGSGTATKTSKGLTDGYLIKFDSTGLFNWVFSNGDADNNVINKIGIDPLENIVVVGDLENNKFIAKLNQNGQVLWTKEVNGIKAFDLDIDKHGNIFIIGEFNGTVDFDPGTGVVSKSSLGSFDAFVLKLDHSGIFNWVKTFGGTTAINGVRIVLDDSKNIYSTGDYFGSVNLNPGGTHMVTSKGKQDIYLQKLDSNGAFVWAKTFGNNEIDYSHDLLLDSMGNIILTGSFERTVDFNPGSGTFNMTAKGFKSDAYVLKLNSNGQFVWSKSYGWNGYDFGLSLASNAEGNIFLSGIYNDSIEFNTGAKKQNFYSKGKDDIFLLELDPTGNVEWATTLGSNNDDWSRIALTKEFKLVLSGNFYDTLFTDFGTPQQILVSHGFNDVFVQSIEAGSCEKLSANLDLIQTNSLLQSKVNNATYKWLDCDKNYTIINGEINKSFSPIKNGRYAVEVSRLNCIDTSECIEMNYVNIHEFKGSQRQLIVFPNPTSNYLTIKSLMNEKVLSYTLFDMLGSQVGQGRLSNSTIDVSMYQAGSYVLLLQFDDGFERVLVGIE